MTVTILLIGRPIFVGARGWLSDLRLLGRNYGNGTSIGNSPNVTFIYIDFKVQKYD